MGRHLSIAAVLAVLALGTGWWMAGAEHTESPAVEGSAAVDRGARVTAFEATAPQDLGERDEAVVPAPASPSDPRWAALHGRVQSARGSQIQVVIPEDATKFEAHDLQLDAIDAQSTELDGLIVELTELAEDTADPPTRVEALVELGEVYLELSEHVDGTPVPEWMRPRRARRLQDDIGERSGVARDKARMVLEMALGSAQVSPGQRSRIAKALEET